MGNIKGRKILGVILFCFVLSAVHGMPGNAIRNNLYSLGPLSNASVLFLLSTKDFDNQSVYTLPGVDNSSFAEADDVPFSIVDVSTTPVCAGEASTVTIHSIPASLPDGTYTVTYELSAPNASSGNTATMVVNNGTGSFTSINLITIGNTTITIKYLQSGSIGNTITAAGEIINVSIAPVVTIGNNIPAICMTKTTVPLGATVTANAFATWSSSVDGTFSDVHDPNATWTPNAEYIGIATLTITATNGCEIVSKAKTVEVKAMPTVQIKSATNPICQGGSSTLEGSFGGSATGISWTCSEGGTFSDVHDPNATWTPPASFSGSAIITLTTTGSPCNIPESKTIVVNPTIGPASFTEGKTTVCQDDTDETYTATAANSTSITYSVLPTTAGTINSSTGVMDWDAAFTGKATIKATALGLCGSTSATRDVTVNPNPTIDVPSNQAVCNGQSTSAINFTGSVDGTVFNWTNKTPGIGLAASGTGNIGAFTAVNTGNSVVTASVTVTPVYTNAGKSCSGTSKTFTITVYPTADVVATPASQTLCSGESTSVALTGSVAGTTFSWTVAQSGVTGAAAGSGDNIAQTLTATGNAPGTATYTITPRANNCNGNPVIVVITVNPLPLPTISGSASSCSGSSGNTYSTETGMTNYVWSVSAGGIITSGAGTHTITVSWSTVGAQVVTVKYTDANGCTASPVTIKDIIVNPKPNVLITNPAAVCFPSTADLTASTIKSGSTADLTYTYWSDAAATIQMANPTVAGAGTYWIQGTTPLGCSDIKPVTVTVHPKPTVVITNPEPVCSPSTVDLSAPSITAGSTTGLVYSYWKDAAATVSLANHTTVSVSGTYYIKGTNSNGCFDIQSVTVIANQTPTVTTTNAIPVCSGVLTPIDLKADVENTTFTWTVGIITGTVTGATEGSGNSISQILTSSGNGGTVQYIVTPTSPAGCVGAPYTITVTVQTPPTVYQHPEDPNLVCDDGFATLIAHAYGLPTPTVQWQVSTNGGSSWTNLTDVSGITGSQSNVLSVYDPPTGRKYRAAFTNSSNCGAQPVYSNVSTITVSGDVKIFAPFAVSGCGDGTYNLFIELQGDQVSRDDADSWAEWFDGDIWREVPNSHQTLRNGHPTYSLNIFYNDYPPGALFKIIVLTKKCAIVFNTNPLPFGNAGQITVANACVNRPVTFTHNGTTGGTWTIKNATGAIVYTLANAAGNQLIYTPSGEPGCYSATYASGICSDTKSFVVFPEVVTNPTLQQNSCGAPLVMTPAIINSFFTTEYSILAPGSSTWSAYRDLNATNAAFTNTPGCWTVKSRYKTNQACDLNPAGIISPCAESTVSAVVFPTAPVLSAPFNTCNSSITLPVVPAISGFTTEWKVDGGAYTSTPIVPSTPGCHTLQARYVLTSACGVTPAGAFSSNCESNVVSVVIFPLAPPAPTLNAGCGADITVTPPPVPTGFSVEYSFNDGIAGSWGPSNTYTAPSSSCTGYKIKTRYVLTDPCGLTGKWAASSVAACGESPATIRLVDISAPVITCTTPFPSPVCVNTATGDVYVHSGINWDATVTDNCTITSITASLSGATTAANLTTLNHVTFNIGTTTVTWSATDACNPATTCSFTVTVNPKPYINHMTAIVCSGSSFTVTPLDGTNGLIPTGTTYSWSAPTVAGITGTAAGSNASSIGGTLINSNTTDTDVEYMVTPVTGSCPGTPFKVTVTVHPAPVMADPKPATFCVENITQAIYNESTMDIEPGRPDHYTLQPGDLALTANMTLHWSITDALGAPVTDTKGALLTNITGTVTNYISTVAPIVLMGAPEVEVSYTISYWLVDLCNISTPVKTAIITIKPRPNFLN